MIERDEAFAILAGQITDEIVVTGVGSQTASWLEVKPRPLNLYLRGPMGLATAVGLGVALAHPDRRVMVLEGDGGMLMGLTSLAAVAQCRPTNLVVVCLDNGIYESGGQGPTVNAGRTDFVRIAQGFGIARAEDAADGESLQRLLAELLPSGQCAFVHVPIGQRRRVLAAAHFRPVEVKLRFQAALRVNAGLQDRSAATGD
jgi:thiamine pyrophosphate-dependent acetolactate synthase large subunit-like protein